MDERLRERALRQGGAFTWQDVQACLLGVNDVRSALRRHEAVRVRRNAYVLAEVWRGATPEAQLALATRAVLLTRPDDMASHESALALFGLPIWGLPTDCVQLVSDCRRSRAIPGAYLHPRGDIAVTDVSGTPSVGVATALAQVAVTRPLPNAVVPLDRALKEKVCRAPQVRAAGEQIVRGPLDRRRLEAALAHADKECESVGETRTRFLLLELGYQFRSQVRISDHEGVFVGRVDFMIGDLLVVEFDGLVKYEGADGREALAQEKAREERLTALGCVVVRLVWGDLDHPEKVRAMIEAALRRIARRS